MVVPTAGFGLVPELENGVSIGRLNLHIAIPALHRNMAGLELVITIIAAILTTLIGLGATPPAAIHDGSIVMWVALTQIQPRISWEWCDVGCDNPEDAAEG